MGETAFDDPTGWLSTARSLARKAGATIVAHRYPVAEKEPSFAINSKTTSIDLVTSADLASQKIIFDALSSLYPDHQHIGEEDAVHAPLTDAPTWIVDAIDGTTNYVHGLSDVAISIGLSINRQVVLGVVYNPFANEMFHALRGRGAFLNDRPIHSSSCSSLSTAIVVSEWGYDRTPDGVHRMLEANRRLLLANIRGVRQIGSGSLDMCYVAAGRVDAVYTGVAGETWKIWDYAAASLIAEEAGATLSTLDGKEFHITSATMVCSAPALIDELVRTVNGDGDPK